MQRREYPLELSAHGWSIRWTGSAAGTTGPAGPSLSAPESSQGRNESTLFETDGLAAPLAHRPSLICAGQAFSSILTAGLGGTCMMATGAREPCVRHANGRARRGPPTTPPGLLPRSISNRDRMTRFARGTIPQAAEDDHEAAWANRRRPGPAPSRARCLEWLKRDQRGRESRGDKLVYSLRTFRARCSHHRSLVFCSFSSVVSCPARGYRRSAPKPRPEERPRCRPVGRPMAHAPDEPVPLDRDGAS